MSDFVVGVDWTTPQHGNSAHADLKAIIAEQAAEIATLQSKADALADALTSIKNAQQSAVSFHDLRVFAAKAITTYKE